MKTWVAVRSDGGMELFVCVRRGDTGVVDLKWVLRCVMKEEGSGREVVGDGLMNSPGRRRVAPYYTISAAVEDMSSLIAVRIPRSMRGRVSIQASGCGWVLRAAFNWRCREGGRGDLQSWWRVEEALESSLVTNVVG